jgi:carbonic anhydrase
MRKSLMLARLGLALAVPLGAKVDFSEAMEAYERAEAPEEPEAPARGAAAHGHHAGGGEPWARLQAGNQRHREGRWSHPGLNLKRRQALAQGQKPFAAVLSCADSRVPPELVFDQGLGDLFVVRVAGNVAGPFDRASLEYGVEHLGIGLLVVLGHERCGAVKASLELEGKAGDGLSPDLKALVGEIAPAVKGKQGPGALDEAVHDNALLSARRLLERSAVLREAVEKGHLRVVSARYDLDSGAVETVDR